MVSAGAELIGASGSEAGVCEAENGARITGHGAARIIRAGAA